MDVGLKTVMLFDACHAFMVDIVDLKCGYLGLPLSC